MSFLFVVLCFVCLFCYGDLGVGYFVVVLVVIVLTKNNSMGPQPMSGCSITKLHLAT